MDTSVVVFPIGADRYAIAADSVREVVSDCRPTRLPTAPGTILGAINLRGEVLPLFDSAALLGIGTLAQPAVAATSIAIVVDTAAGLAGLMVSDLPRVAIFTEQIGPSNLRGTLGVFEDRDGVAVLVDIETLLVPHAHQTEHS